MRDRRVVVTGAGLLALLVAIGPPLDGAAHDRLSLHMVQHVLLLGVAAPLLVAGHQLPALVRSLPPVWRRRLRPVTRSRVGGGWAIRAAAAVLLQAAVLWAWHVPGLYEAALRNRALHALEHASFLGAACLFWWAVVGASRRSSYGAGVVALFLSTLPAMALGVLMTLASTSWYPDAYGRGASALEDQQVAGAVMWGFGGLASVIAAAALFAAWLRASERLSPGLAVLLLAVLALGGCSGGSDERSRVVEGSPSLGEDAIEKYGCGSCHTIPGVRGADALVGPPLSHWSERTFIAGQLANTPDNLVRWIRDPKDVEPGTAMPDLGVSTEEARNIAAYLYQLD